MPLKAILAQSETFPDLLDRPDCPWSDEVKSVLRPLLKPPISTEIDLEGAEPEEIEAQILTLMRDLKVMGQGLSSKDHSEKIQYYKLVAGLSEKLISLRERVINIREMSEFQSIVVQFLEEICTKDQISDLMGRLKDLQSIGEMNDLRS